MRNPKRFTIIELHVLIAIVGILLLAGSSQGCFIVSDLSGDCQVDIDDMAIVASQWMGAFCDGETGLAVHWKLNESSGTKGADSSGLNHIANLAGPSWNPSGGKLGGALEFNGDRNYVWSSYLGITGSNPRTCAAWMKTDQPIGAIMAWGNRDVDGASWVVCIDGTGVLRVDVGGGYIIGTTVLTDDLWHHIAVTSDGSATDSIVLFVDGRAEMAAEIASQPINTEGTSTTKLGVFQLPFMEGDYFNGLIDDARIYDRVLSIKEIWKLAATGTTNYSCPDLNADDIVNLEDFTHLSQDWGNGTPPISISEFMADNESKSPLESGEIFDGNYESSDWIELHNNSQHAIDIGGWYLTDDSSDRTRWQLPSGSGQLVLQPGDYLIVFASGKTKALNPGNYPYVDPAGYLHTNFQLSNNGEYLGLIAADGTTPIDEYTHVELSGGEYGYPQQAEDISYGYYYGQPRYFPRPTPGADNSGSFTGFAEKPNVSVKGGCYVDGFDVTMSCDTEGAFIRYTTDGTVPGLINGTTYSGPILLDSLTTIIAKSFKPGLQPSDTRIETYVFLQSDVAAFNSNLPIVVIDTHDVVIPQDRDNKPWTHCQAVIIDTDDVTGRANITGPEHFEGLGQIRYRGESTYGTRRHFAFEVLDEYGLDKDVSLLGMPAESDWVITGERLDYTLLKCEIAFKWFRDMGHWAPDQRYVEMYVNEGGGAVSASDYKGIFVIREKIKRSKNRVDIARLDTSHNLEPKVSGGYIIKCDKLNVGDTLLTDHLEAANYGIHWTGNGKPILEEPGPLELTQPQLNWITNYINEFHSVLWKNTGSDYYPGSGPKYVDYIDVISWLDHFIVEQSGADSDAFWGSYYTHKGRDGKIHSGPTWDFDRGFHNNGGSANLPTAWKSNTAIFGRWHLKLQEDLEYKTMLADRWFEHREDVLDTNLTMAHIDQTVDLITEAMGRSIDKYGFPGSGGNYAGEVALFKNWITDRLNYLDGQFASRFAKKPPVLTPVGGYVNPGSSLDINKPSGASGTIYYTLNGTDPRLAGGAINPDARIYEESGGAIIESVVTMSASSWKYLYDGSDQGTAWQEYGFNDSSWGLGQSQLGFSNTGTEGDENTDIGPRVIGRRTAYFRHEFNLSNVSEITALSIDLLYDDGAVVYINEQEVDRVHMPDGTIYFDTKANVQGENSTITFSGIDPSLLNEGNNILAVEVHQNADNSSDISFDLALQTTRPSGSVQIVFDKSTCVTARIKDGSNWSAKNIETYAVGPVVENLRITELMYHPADPNTEFIELQNVGSEAINLNLVEFTKGVDFVLGDTSLAAGEYGVIVENIAEFTDKYGTGLNIIGQYLGALDNDGDRIKFKDAIGVEIQDFDYKDGWYELTDGLDFSLTMVNPASIDPNDWDSKSGWRSSLHAGGTPGQAPETALAADSIVINEILAHSHAGDPDWIELYNTTAQEINIGGWFLSDDDDDSNLMRKYQIPANTVISAGSYKVFIEDDSFGDLTPTGSNVPFGLSEGGNESVYLYSGQGGELTGLYQTQQKFDASETDISIGRYEKIELSGGYDFVRMSSTQGYANNAPLPSDIVITEIHYDPIEGTDFEYVELYNRSGEDVLLMTSVTTYSSETSFTIESLPWRLKGTGFVFPANTTIPAGSYVIVANDPDNYTSTPFAVYGPFDVDSKLDNGGEEIELQMPGDLEYGKERYWIPLEKIEYSDGSHPVGTDPWPTTPDGGGDSLNRININIYGRDYSNWQAATPTPGT